MNLVANESGNNRSSFNTISVTIFLIYVGPYLTTSCLLDRTLSVFHMIVDSSLFSLISHFLKGPFTDSHQFILLVDKLGRKTYINCVDGGLALQLDLGNLQP